MDNLDLTAVAEGETVTIVAFDGGRGMTARLAALGITIGSTITKKSSQLLRGPVVIQHGSTQVAIGFGMARRIYVKRRNK